MITINELIARRCRQLAEGADVPDREDGICWDVLKYLEQCERGVRVPALYPRLQAAFVAFGLDDGDPLGDYWIPGDKWEGERGERRRELAGGMAEYFENLAAEEVPA